MAALRFVLKSRCNTGGRSFTTWTAGEKHETLESAVAAFQALPDPVPSDIQHAVFHLGKIVAWWQGRSDILGKSRAQKPTQGITTGGNFVVDRRLPPDVEHHLYSFLNGEIAFCSVVARDEDTARRIVENDTDGIDWSKATIEDAGPMPGHNRWVHLDPTSAPMLVKPAEEAPA